MEKKPLIRSG